MGIAGAGLMSWSLNEVEAAARKAAKGAGLSWGLAEDAGRAVIWLEARGLKGAAALAAYLEAGLKDAPCEITAVWRAPAGLCPIASGTYLADCGDIGAGITLEAVCAPILVLPFAATAAQVAHRPITLAWEGGAAEFEPDGNARLQGTPPSGAGDLTLAPGAAKAGTLMAIKTRSEADCGAMGLLNFYAARTYAPATEASRLSGAGAGTSDND